jgi:Protein of unknown function (DUF3306)
MSDLEDAVREFLRRWSKRKRAETADHAEATPAKREVYTSATAQSEGNMLTFDPAVLPPIESITATSDIRAFLAPGVPEELTRAALRRVWVADPKIRDFIGIAENQWDFNKRGSVPGFGSLELTPGLRRMVANLISDEPRQTNEQQAEVRRVEQISEISRQLPPSTKTLAPGADDNSAKPSQARTESVISADTRADPDRIIARDSNSDPAVEKSLSKADEKPQSFHRKHGGAVPK